MVDDSVVNDDIQNDDVVGDVQDTTPQSDSDFMNDTVDYIKDTQNIINDSDIDTNADGITSDVSDFAGTDIPDDFTDIAEKAGMSKEEIIEFADAHTDEELRELIPYFESQLEESKIDDKVDTKIDDKVEDIDTKDNKISAELEQQIAERVAKQLEEKFQTTLEDINKFKAHQEKQSTQHTVEVASKKFDEAAKELPIFGKTDELPKFTTGKLAGKLVPTSPAMKARLEALEYADAFISKGQNIEEAMDNAIYTYMGKHSKKEMERSLIKDLKNHETKLSGSRAGKETKKKYTDTRDEIIDEIRQMQRAAGVD